MIDLRNILNGSIRYLGLLKSVLKVKLCQRVIGAHTRPLRKAPVSVTCHVRRSERPITNASVPRRRVSVPEVVPLSERLGVVGVAVRHIAIALDHRS